MAFNVSFLCSPSKKRSGGLSPIEVSITLDGKRTCVQTDKRCRPEEFRALLESRKTNDVRTYCDAVRVKLETLYTQLYVQGKTITAARLKDYLLTGGEKSFTLKELVNEYINKTVKTTTAYRKYKVTFDRFLKEYGEDTEVSDITTQDIINYKLKFEKDKAQSTTRGELKRVKSLFIYAFNAGKISKNPFASIRFSFKDPEQPFLNYEEIEKIREVKLEERLDSVRNFFLFLCFTGLEYADVVHLEKSDVKRNQYGQLYVKKPRVKSGVTYISIFYEDAEELWELFDGGIPVISNQKANAYLKEVAEAAGIDKKVTTLTARHTYACYLLNEKKLPIDIVQKMLGHASARQSLHYAKMLDETVFAAARIPQKMRITETKRDLEDIEEFNRLLGIDDKGSAELRSPND